MLYIPLSIKRCTKCGEWKPANRLNYPLTSGKQLFSWCKTCNARKTKQWHDQHRDRAKPPAKPYSLLSDAQKQKKNERTRQWRKENQEKVRISKKAWYLKNIDRERANSRRRVNELRETNPDLVKQKKRAWQLKHADTIRVIQQRRRSLEHNLPSTFTTADWEQCLSYFNYRCAVCDRPQGLWHKLAQDHWIPVSKGGSYTPNNIVPLCHGADGCNNSKCNNDPHKWLVAKFGKKKAQDIELRISRYFASLEAHD